MGLAFVAGVALVLGAGAIAFSKSKTYSSIKGTVTARLTLEELLNKGEALPPKDQRMNYAMMRAPRAMMRFCDDTLAHIAMTCEIFKTTTNDIGNNVYQVRADFAYVPNYTIGDVTRIKGGDFVSAFLPDTNETRTHQTPEERKAFLSEMLDICAALRADYGNCLIGTAGFYTERAARFSGTGVSAHAAAWVEVYLPDNPFEQRNFQGRVDAILAENDS